MKPGKQFKLEDDPIWKEAADLGEYMYDRVAELPEDEKWNVAIKLRNAATDCMFYIALAVGNPGPVGCEYDWGAARKYAAALRTMYRFAGRQKLISLDPTTMVRLDKLLKQIESERLKSIDRSAGQIKTEQARDLKPWLEKYEIWKKLNQEKKL